jgi:hypothetical protein
MPQNWVWEYERFRWEATPDNVYCVWATGGVWRAMLQPNPQRFPSGEYFGADAAKAACEAHFAHGRGKPRYRMLFRPPGFATLPRDIVYTFVEAPWNWSHGVYHSDLPRSQHRHGVFETNRELTEEELRTFEIQRL